MIKKYYEYFCKTEQIIAAGLLVSITIMVFLSALGRTIGYPLNWATDISLLFFAWLVFLGGDIIIRSSNLIGIDMISKLFPENIQRMLKIIFLLMIIAFLMVLVVYGIPLSIDNKKRLFQATNLSYSWCTISVPVGSALMIISSCINLRKLIKGEDK